MKSFRYFTPTEVIFGCHALKDFAEKDLKKKTERVLIVTGKTSALKSGALEMLRNACPSSIIFDQVPENPTTEVCDNAAKICREYACDMILAVGGGSPMDVAKAAAGLMKNEGLCSDFFGSGLFRNGALPVIAIPTTAGTGSEVTPYSVIVDSRTNMKKSIADPSIFPKIAVLDPVLTVTMPRHVTTNTGLDALSQAMEGFLSVNSTPLGDVLALEVCRLVKAWLPRAIADGNDLDARSHMLFAAMMSGCVIAQSGTTLVHGLGYAFTTHCGVPHGLANALLLAPVFQFNARITPEKVAQLSAALGFPTRPEPGAASQSIGIAVHTLLQECGVSPAAKMVGVDETRLADFAEQVAAEPYRFRNQIGKPTYDDLLRMYRASYDGVFLDAAE
ncbi:MAG TPA: iron-containing alcohol dehydrogenase [Candidatus Hydrogenedentes bacterium]|nr:iron-containing alcohol dehydrogenase [Candidatus Hydrogenedentota bacterium]